MKLCQVRAYVERIGCWAHEASPPFPSDIGSNIEETPTGPGKHLFALGPWKMLLGFEASGLEGLGLRILACGVCVVLRERYLGIEALRLRRYLEAWGFSFRHPFGVSVQGPQSLRYRASQSTPRTQPS